MSDNHDSVPLTVDVASPDRHLGVVSATLLVVASMIGVGIFTTTGYLVADVPSLTAILIAWGIGGAASLCGALAYAELSVLMPRNGGEYQILARLFHPAIGFMSAWVSLVVGFCAPIAASSLAFGKYLETAIPGGYDFAASLCDVETVTSLVAVALVVTLSSIHIFHVAHGSRFQNVFTVVKVLLLTAFIVVGLSRGDVSRISGDSRPIFTAIFTPTFAVGLIYISYSYTGWNAAAYVAGEIRNPRRNLPIALGLGTLIVTALYLGLNVLFLAAVPYEQLAGVETVAHMAASQLFGTEAARFVSLLLAVGLVSMVGAIIMTGSRVYETVGQDFTALRWLARRRPNGGPVVALLAQALVTIIMIAVGNLQTIIEFVGFTLALFSALTVCGVFVIRRRVADSEATFRMPGYPVTPLIFVLLMGWVVAVSIYQKPFISLVGVGTLLSGFVLYLAAVSSLKK